MPNDDCRRPKHVAYNILSNHVNRAVIDSIFPYSYPNSCEYDQKMAANICSSLVAYVGYELVAKYGIDGSCM